MTVDQAYAKSTSVFLGQVMANSVQGYYVVATLKVLRTWKGTRDSVVKVRTFKYQSMCGVAFELSERYLIYAYDNQGSLATDICARSTREQYAKADITELDKKYSVGH